jgi:membrane protease YdiL (CAAX protease family)
VPDDGLRLRLMVTAGLLVAGIGGAWAVAFSVIGRLAGHRLFPPVRAPRAGWPGAAVVGAFVLFVLLNLFSSLAIHAALIESGFFRLVYGPDFPTAVPERPTPADEAAQTIRMLWAAVIAFPIQIAAIVGFVHAFRLPDPVRMRGWRMNVVAGYLTWLIVTPAAFAVFVLASYVHLRLTGRPPQKHPLTGLGETVGPWEWTLFVLQTVVVAPVLEEWLFRGVMLGWLAQKRVPPDGIPPPQRAYLVTGAAALITTFLVCVNQNENVPHEFATNPVRAVATYVVPGSVMLLMIPAAEGLVRMRWLRRHLRLRSDQQVRGIMASSALFAAVHANVWPSPIPLIVLAMALGYLYLRTRSLIGPIIVHGLFNAVSATYLLIGGPA